MLRVFYFTTCDDRRVACSIEDSKALFEGSMCFLEDMSRDEIIGFQNKLKTVMDFFKSEKIKVIELDDLIKLLNIKTCNFRKVKLKMRNRGIGKNG